MKSLSTIQCKASLETILTSPEQIKRVAELANTAVYLTMHDQSRPRVQIRATPI